MWLLPLYLGALVLLGLLLSERLNKVVDEATPARDDATLDAER